MGIQREIRSGNMPASANALLTRQTNPSHEPAPDVRHKCTNTVRPRRSNRDGC